MDNSQASIKKSSMNYGYILGGSLALLTVVLYAVNLESLTQWWIGIITLLFALAMGIVSTAKAKSLLGGFLSFKQGFTAYFITVAIGLLIAVLVNIVLFNFIDPEAAEVLKESIMEMSEGMMRQFGAPEAEIEKALADMENENSFAIGQQVQSYFFQLIFYSIFGLLIALIMKKKDPNA